MFYFYVYFVFNTAAGNIILSTYGIIGITYVFIENLTILRTLVQRKRNLRTVKLSKNGYSEQIKKTHVYVNLI